MSRRLVINPDFELVVSGSARRRDRSMLRFELPPEDLALLRWMVGSRGKSTDEVAMSPDLRETAIRYGFLVPSGDVPEKIAGFRVPAAERPDPAAALASDFYTAPVELEVNRRWSLQRHDVLPAEIADRVRLGKDLWRHLGASYRGPRGAAQERPLLWVEHPHWALWEPLSVAGDFSGELQGLLLGKIQPSELPPAAAAAFRQAHVLVPRDHRRAPAVPWPDSLDALRAGLESDGYAVLPELFSPAFMTALRRHLRALRAGGYFEVDEQQVHGMRDGMYCEEASMFIAHQLAQVLNQIVPETLRLAHTWTYRYRPGAVLKRHKDRAQCKWNVSFCVNTEPVTSRADAWPLYLQVREESRAIRLAMGDAVLYSGTDLWHWRDALPPDRAVTMCFFHYALDSYRAPLG